MKNRLLIFALLLTSFAVHAQNNSYPRNYFASPMDIPLELAGNFGELRPNHFHTGIDITTHGQEGLDVKAAAEGYVSRIKIGPWGYGRVIYIDHPNGYTTVYGHLSRMSNAMETWVKLQQYKAESFEVELFPNTDQFRVKKGEVVAYSGNTGSSGGPHLHFEIRDTKTEEALNPLLFGLPVKDNVAPTLVSLVVYPAGGAEINSKSEPRRYLLKASGSKYVLANPADSIVVCGQASFAIEAYDKENIPTGKNGVYAIRLQKNKRTVYAHRLDRIAFDKSRYINCFIDYEEHEKKNRYLMRSFLLPNNQLNIYDTVIGRGYFDFRTDSTYKFTYTASDIFGNSASVDFKVKSLSKHRSTGVPDFGNRLVQVLLWDTTNLIEENDFAFRTPSGAFYDKLVFTSSVSTNGTSKYPVVRLGSPYDPVHYECALTIFADIPETLRTKALIVSVNAKGGLSAVGGTWDNKGIKPGITAGIKEFGTYSIRIDTTAPKIIPSNFDLKGKTQSDLGAFGSLKFTISDNLSGIASYRATIDGKWILLEYEPKKKTFWHSFDDRTEKGKHELVIEASDKCGNKTTYKKSFTR